MSRSAATLLVVLGVLAAGAGATYVSLRGHSGPPADLPVADVPEGPMAELAATLTVDAKERGVTLPPEIFQKAPPRSEIRFKTKLYPRDFREGIEIPGGGYLPLLNGVPFAPAVKRHDRLGPMPPIVGKFTDKEGNEWWAHEDGSHTTSRWTDVTVMGNVTRTVAVNHTYQIDDKFGLPPMQDPK